jgi:hypothetical protein
MTPRWPASSACPLIGGQKTLKAEVDATILKIEADIKDYTAILKSDERCRDVYVNELEEIKRSSHKLGLLLLL